MLHPVRYAELLADKMREHQVRAWLVNTGWSGGPYGVGSRMKLAYTRAAIDAIHDGTLAEVPVREDPIFGTQGADKLAQTCRATCSCLATPGPTPTPMTGWPDGWPDSSTRTSRSTPTRRARRSARPDRAWVVIASGMLVALKVPTGREVGGHLLGGEGRTPGVAWYPSSVGQRLAFLGVFEHLGFEVEGVGDLDVGDGAVGILDGGRGGA